MRAVMNAEAGGGYQRGLTQCGKEYGSRARF